MLKIRLQPPFYTNRKWCVFLNFGLRKEFPNKRAAEDLTRQMEAELSQALLFISEEYSKITEFYRVYFIADRDYRFKYLVENSFGYVDNRLNFIISSDNFSPNHNTFVHQAIINCLTELLNVCTLISKKALQRYDCLTRNRIELRIRVIETYLDQLNLIVRATYSKQPILKAV